MKIAFNVCVLIKHFAGIVRKYFQNVESLHKEKRFFFFFFLFMLSLNIATKIYRKSELDFNIHSMMTIKEFEKEFEKEFDRHHFCAIRVIRVIRKREIGHSLSYLTFCF